MRYIIFLWCSLITCSVFAHENTGDFPIESMTLTEFQRFVLRFHSHDNQSRFDAIVENDKGEIVSVFEHCEQNNEGDKLFLCKTETESLEIFAASSDLRMASWAGTDGFFLFFADYNGVWADETIFEIGAPHYMNIEKRVLNGQDSYRITVSCFDFEMEKFEECTTHYEGKDLHIICFRKEQKASEMKVVIQEKPDGQYEINARWISPPKLNDPVYFRAYECPICSHKNEALIKFRTAVRARMKTMVDAAIRALTN